MGSDKCYKDCELGYYANGDICSLCKPGYYSEKSSTECIKCPLGTFNSLFGNNHCEECDIGYYNDQLGSDKCKKCQPNFYSNNKGAIFCKECEIDK